MAVRLTPRQKLDALIDLFVPDIRSAFMASIQDVVDNVLIRQLVEYIESGDVVGAFRSLGFSDAAMRPLVASIERAFEQGGIMTGKTFPQYLNTPSGRVVFRFDVRNSVAENWLRTQSSSLVTRIQEDTRVALMNVLTDGMRDGVNPRQVALDIVGRIDPTTQRRVGGIIGLTSGQERWVASARTKLRTLDAGYFNMELRDKRFDSIVRKAIENGKPLDADTVDKLVDRYKANALRYRGEAIARTEALQSLNMAEYQAMKQAVAMGAVNASAVRRHWDSAGDSRVRWSHKSMDRKYHAEGVGLDEPFVSPSGAAMMHPGDTSLGAGADEVVMCRCRVRLKVDWMADID